MSITPKNWKSFQHYRDRSPGWIKLHRTLLDNPDYHALSPEAGKALPLLWLLASEKDGMIPAASVVAFRLRIAAGLAADILAELVERDFFVHAGQVEPSERSATPAQQDDFNSRHITDGVKREVWARDGGVCCCCGSAENIEYDHKIPVSKGGSGEADNIQLLCRPCNRRKRAAAQVERIAPSKAEVPVSRRSLEKEGERELEGEAETRAVADATRPRAANRFEEFWKAYPRRDGANPRSPAEKKFKALIKTGVDPQMLIDAVVKLAAEEVARGNIGTRFIPLASTWLNQQRWSDHAAVAFLAGERDSEMQLEEAVKMWARLGRWSRFAGPEPGLTGCRASPELFAKYGMHPDGRRIEKQDESA